MELNAATLADYWWLLGSSHQELSLKTLEKEFLNLTLLAPVGSILEGKKKRSVMSLVYHPQCIDLHSAQNESWKCPTIY